MRNSFAGLILVLAATAVSVAPRTLSASGANLTPFVSLAQLYSTERSQESNWPELSPLSAEREESNDSTEKPPRFSAIEFWPMVWSLALVTGLFLIFHWITRKVPQHDRPLPAEVVECLGRGTLSGKQEVQLVRLGSTLLLVAKAAGGPSTLASIDDPEEVERLTTLCKNPERSAEVLVEMLARGRRDRERSRSGAFEGESARA